MKPHQGCCLVVCWKTPDFLKLEFDIQNYIVVNAPASVRLNEHVHFSNKCNLHSSQVNGLQITPEASFI